MIEWIVPFRFVSFRLLLWRESSLRRYWIELNWIVLSFVALRFVELTMNWTWIVARMDGLRCVALYLFCDCFCYLRLLLYLVMFAQTSIIAVVFVLKTAMLMMCVIWYQAKQEFGCNNRILSLYRTRRFSLRSIVSSGQKESLGFWCRGQFFFSFDEWTMNEEWTNERMLDDWGSESNESRKTEKCPSDPIPAVRCSHHHLPRTILFCLWLAFLARNKDPSHRTVLYGMWRVIFSTNDNTIINLSSSDRICSLTYGMALILVRYLSTIALICDTGKV